MENCTLDLISNEVPENTEELFLRFIDSYRTENGFFYKDMLNRSVLSETYLIEIQLHHINEYSNSLYNIILSDPNNIVGKLETILTTKYMPTNEIDEELPIPPKHSFSIHFHSKTNYTPLRQLTASLNNKLVRVRGIVVSTSVPIYRPRIFRLVCKRCLRAVNSQFMLRACSPSCGLDPFDIDADLSVVFEEQFVKMQELFEDIPAGEMPRHFGVCLERTLVDAARPGDHLSLTGIVQLRERVHNKSNQQNVSNLVIKALGIQQQKKGIGLFFNEKEKALFLQISKHNIHGLLLKMLAPQIHGHFDIKKAILCLLFSGTRRIQHNVSHRGDINILLLGDPGCAKSQLLKFTNLIAPGIYTSGKGSSAAGLTACVVRRKTGEFALEGGALVLSDLGVCCIDEFDKMELNDRVAIHEAMEQQTISIAKAGINTTLNTRCAILAAANPVFGRYDEYRALDENIDFGSTILSRFDCIFIVKDKDDREKDIRLAKHLLSLTLENSLQNYSQHYPTNADDLFNISNKPWENKSGDEALRSFDFDNIFESSITFLRRYIAFAKNCCFPTLTAEAQKKLTDFYVKTRQMVKYSQNAIPITVRQLESLIRISESLAKMELKESVELYHVNEAIRLFTSSTIDAVTNGHCVEGMGKKENEIFSISEEIKKLLPMGTASQYDHLLQKLVHFDPLKINVALDYLVKQNKITLRDSGKTILRLY